MEKKRKRKRKKGESCKALRESWEGVGRDWEGAKGSSAL